MKKRKPSVAKKRATSQTPDVTRKRKSHVRTQGRTALIAPTATVPLPDDDEDLFIAPGFQFELPMDPVQGPKPVVVTTPLALPRDINAALDQSFRQSPALSPGFNERGVCAYGCDGCVSIKDPMLGMHDWACPFWDSPEGVKLMLRFEKTDFPPFK